MLDMVNLYSLIPALMTLVSTLGHRFTEKLELVQSFWRKLAWINSDGHDDWLYACEEGESGSFKHLVFLYLKKGEVTVYLEDAIPQLGFSSTQWF